MRISRPIRSTGGVESLMFFSWERRQRLGFDHRDQRGRNESDGVNAQNLFPIGSQAGWISASRLPCLMIHAVPMAKIASMGSSGAKGMTSGGDGTRDWPVTPGLAAELSMNWMRT